MVAEHMFRLQPSINLHGSVSAFMFSGYSGTGALPRMHENSGIPCAVILKPYIAYWQTLRTQHIIYTDFTAIRLIMGRNRRIPWKHTWVSTCSTQSSSSNYDSPKHPQLIGLIPSYHSYGTDAEIQLPLKISRFQCFLSYPHDQTTSLHFSSEHHPLPQKGTPYSQMH